MRRAGLLAALLLATTACDEPIDPRAPSPSADVAAAGERRWVIVFNQPNDLPQNAERVVAFAGGTIVTAVPEIGALVATSADPAFAATVASHPLIHAVSENVAVQAIPQSPRLTRLAVEISEEGGPVEPPGSDAQTGPDPGYVLQWDKKRMRASNSGSYAVQRGRPDVVVGIMDSGVEVLPAPHQDINQNLDYARSRSFTDISLGVNGNPSPAAWDDKHGHGSWCASAVAAPINARGITGVAPGVRLVALKTVNDDGTGDPFAVVLALVYAGLNHFDVVSMSFGLYIPHAGGQAIITATQRALEFARANGVTPLAALSNENLDISDGSVFGPFIVMPAELPGVIGVSATGYYNEKAWYSNYGVGKTDVSAPGGDILFQNAPESGTLGLVVGAWAWESFRTCIPGRCYALAEGTSMATPNAAGVAALIISQYGDFSGVSGQKPHMAPTLVESILQQTANNQPCPEPNTVTYDIPQEPPAPPLTLTATCSGDAGGYTNFFGKGIVDALKAVTLGPGAPLSSQ